MKTNEPKASVATKKKRRPATTPELLFDADPHCQHKLDPNRMSGVRCLKCAGWFCY